MKILPLTYNRAGYVHTQVERDDKSAIYVLTRPDFANPKRVIAFEVFAIRKREASTAFGRDYEASERLPCDADFGKTAKSCNTLECARGLRPALLA